MPPATRPHGSAGFRFVAKFSRSPRSSREATGHPHPPLSGGAATAGQMPDTKMEVGGLLESQQRQPPDADGPCAWLAAPAGLSRRGLLLLAALAVAAM
eukprot:COSAG04_NODE_3636_length_2655_cov_2.246479_1_plen_98_part_00